MGFEGIAISARMRDVMEKLVRSNIDSMRPRYRYAVVNGIDRVNRKCDVTFTGDPAPVRVNMGSVQPKEVGQTVRVEGIGTDKFITDVMGPAYSDVPPWSTNSLDFNTLVQRNEFGQISITAPESGSHGANKDYVDTLNNARWEGVNLGKEDLNNVTAPGRYFQGSNVNATAARNYPPGELAGVLEVLTYPVNSAHIYQRYTTYRHSQFPGETWTRTYSNGWSAWAIIGAIPLPNPQTVTGESVNVISATSWANFPGTDLLISLSVERACLVSVEYGAWFGKSTTNDLRVGAVISGATTVSVSWPSWGAVLWSAGTVASAQHSTSKTVELNPGTTSFRLRAYVTGGGTANANYPFLTVAPIRWIY